MTRPRTPIIICLAALATAAAGWVVPAAATTYVEMSDAKLLDSSPTVIEGRIVAVEAAPGSDLPAVDYMVEVESLIKGFLPGSALIVRVPGGVRPDGVGLKVWGAPRFAEGEEALLFLTPRRDGTFALHQFMLGAFHIETLGSRKVARRDLSEARALAADGEKAADGPRDLAAFRGWLRDRVEGTERSPDYLLASPETPRKFATVASTTDPPPFGCGDNGGHGARWFQFDTQVPVAFHLHADGQPGLIGGGLPDFQAALRSWRDDPHTPVNYIYLGGTNSTAGLTASDTRNTVVFEDPRDEIGGSFADSGILAVGGPWFRCDLSAYGGGQFHPIVEADIVTNDGVGAFFESLKDPSQAAQELFAHELGHTLGLDHSPHRDALMSALLHNDGRRAAFDVDDLAGIYHLYGRVDTGDGLPPETLTRPAAPSGLTATVDGLTRVELAWSDNSDNESYFRIERRQRGELNFRVVTTVASGRASHTDTVEPETTYTYRVQAQNAAGRSRSSALVAVEMPEDRRPAVPSHLWTAAMSSGRVRLTWQDNSDDEIGFTIELKRQDAWIPIPKDIPPDATAVELFGFTPALDYSFRVRARGSVADSEPSNVSTSTTFPRHVDCASYLNRICFAGGLLAVDAEFRDPESGLLRAAEGKPATDGTGLFWFFTPENVELMVRVFDPPGEERQLFHTGLTDLEYRLTVTDTATGQTTVITNPAGHFCAEQGLVTIPQSKAAERDIRGLLAKSAPDTVEPAALTVVPVEPVLRARGEVSEPCPRGEENLCLLERRFAVELSWIDPRDPGSPKMASAVAGRDATGFFSFLDPSRPEIVFKMLDGRSINNRFWAFATAAHPPIEFSITVTDTATGSQRTYHHSAGDPCGMADTAAFYEAP